MSKHLFKLSLAAAAVSTIGSQIYPNGNNKKKEELTDLSFNVNKNKTLLAEAIKNTEKLCERVKNESGTPGLVISVSVDGVPVYSNGMVKLNNNI